MKMCPRHGDFRAEYVIDLTSTSAPSIPCLDSLAAAPTSCLKTLAERDAAGGRLVLRIRKMGPPIGDIHPRALRDTYEGHVRRDRIRPLRRTSCLKTLAAVSDAPSGCLALRIHKMGPRIDDIHPGALRDTYDGQVRRDRIRPLHV